MSKRSKTKRFYQHSSDAVRQHDERIPYHSTLAEAEAAQKAEKK